MAGTLRRRCRPSATGASTFLFDDRIVIPGPRVAEGTEVLRPRAASRGVQMKILLSWSSGKDSAWTLHVLRREGIGESAAC